MKRNQKGRIAIDRQQYLFEEQRLQHVMQIIEEQLKDAKAQTYAAKQQLKQTRRSIWEELQIGGANMITTAQYLDELNRHGQDFGVYRNNLKKLKLLQKSPYFGRIDFYDHEYRTTEKIYIGVASLVDQASGENLVYDWRAPIASMFYDYGIGPAHYEAPGGVVTGDIQLKRQYHIEHGEIKYMFDSDLTINDDVLQAALSTSADHKMKHIVYTIQREQNQAIRDEASRVLMVNGPAGSGKTSIALHRAAYLLYRYRGQLNADNIMIFSPNQIFSDYIQNVLPELGEENIRQATMQDYIDRRVRPEWLIEDYYAQFEYVLSNQQDPDYKARTAAMEFKSSLNFYNLVNDYLKHLEANAFQFEDIRVWDQTVISKSDVQQLFSKTYSYLPILQRLDKIKRRIHYLLKPLRRRKLSALVQERSNRAEHKGDNERELQRLSVREVNRDLAPVYEQIDAMLTVDVYQLYYEMFQSSDKISSFADPDQLPSNWNQICRITRESFSHKKLLYEDAAPLLYFQGELSGWQTLPEMKHVIIDEAQDYTLFHYQIFRNIFPRAAFTILGDLNQAIHPFLKLTDFQTAVQVFSEAGYDCKLLEMTKSYRSTKQIAHFTSRFLTNQKQIELVEREGTKPKVIAYGANKAAQLAQTIAANLDLGYESVAVICKNETEAKTAADLLKGYAEFNLIDQNTTYFPSGVVILPVYLAKGLEFDAVIIFDASESVYSSEADRNLLYTACTRALHELSLFFQGKLSKLIADVDSDLYAIRMEQ